MTIFPDTNFLIHYRPIDQIDWPTVCGAESVKLVLCLQVVRELNAKKTEPRLSDRASRAIRDIERYRDKEVRPGVTLTIFNHSLRNSDFPDGMSPDDQDDRIIRHLQIYQERNPDEPPAAVISEDGGMKLRCEACGVPLIEPSESDRLPNPQDEYTRKFREQQSELETLRRRIPKLSLEIAGLKSYPLEGQPLELSPSKRWAVLDVEQEIAKQKQEHRKLSRGDHDFESFMYSEDDKVKYNQALDEYFGKYLEYMQARNSWVSSHGTIFEFDLYIANAGTCPATNVDITVLFPAHVSKLIDLDEDDSLGLPVAPKPPKRPNKIGEAAAYFKSLTNPVDVDSLVAMNTVKPPYYPSFRIVDARAAVAKSVSFVVSGGLRNVMHTRSTQIGSFSMSIGEPADAKPFEAEYTVLATELPKLLESRLLFKINRRATE